MKLQRAVRLVTECVEEQRLSLALENIDSGSGRLVPGDLPTRSGVDPGLASVQTGDVLFGKLRPYLRKSWCATFPAHASTELLCLRPAPAVDSRWLGYLVASDPFVEWAVSTSDGAKMPRTSWEKLREFTFSLPSVATQRLIADFLDAETARIDSLVALITERRVLVSERFVAARAEWVLRGLDPISGAGCTEPSRVSKLGILVALQRGHDLPHEARRAGLIPIVSSGGISGRHDVAACEPPGVVTGRYGTIGEVFLIDEPYWPLNTTLYVSDFRGAWPSWVRHLLGSLPLDAESEKSAVGGIDRKVIGDLRVPVPSFDEQRSIARRLDALTATRAEVELRLAREIELLRQHKQALITAAVTGQLDLARDIAEEAS